ncbi:MAG: isoaspartyl peptidase/L-asparaginase, partial [Steroidobacteraceae bacterium]
AGTYAKNGVCAVSATGHGEFFIRTVAAHHICAAVEHRGLALGEAVHELLHGRLRELGGSGGIIAIDQAGRIVTQFSTEGMFRGARDSGGLRQIDIY